MLINTIKLNTIKYYTIELKRLGTVLTASTSI